MAKGSYCAHPGGFGFQQFRTAGNGTGEAISGDRAPHGIYVGSVRSLFESTGKEI